MDKRTYNRNNKINDNRGVTLIEIIVVVLIMSILTSGAVVSLSAVRNMNPGAAADRIASMISLTRKTAIAREADTVKMELTLDGDKYYSVVSFWNGTAWEESTKEKIGGSDLVINVTKSDGSVITVSDATPAEFKFNKSNGSLNQSYKKISVQGSVTKTVTVIKETGRCLIDD